MRSFWLLLVLLAVPAAHADASATFNSLAQILIVSFDTDNYVQDGLAETGGGPVSIAIPVISNSSGVVNISLDKPTGFTSGSSWYINESGIIKNVTDQGVKIRWEANLSGTATLHFDAPAPNLIVDLIDRQAYNYTKQVRVGADNPFQNVSASTVIDGNYSSYSLLELNGSNETDRTIEYGLTITGTNASWTSVPLDGVITFWLRGTSNESVTNQTTTVVVSGGRGGGGSGVSRSIYDVIEKLEDGSMEFEVPHWMDIDVKLGETKEIEIPVMNVGAVDMEFEIKSTSEFLRVLTSEMHLSPDETGFARVEINGEVLGGFQGRVSIDNGVIRAYVFLNVNVYGTPVEGGYTEGPTLPFIDLPISIPQLEDIKENITPYVFGAFMIFAIIAGFLIFMIKKPAPRRKPKTVSTTKKKGRKRRKPKKVVPKKPVKKTVAKKPVKKNSQGRKRRKKSSK